jgi:hypothetical protein
MRRRDEGCWSRVEATASQVGRVVKGRGVRESGLHGGTERCVCVTDLPGPEHGAQSCNYANRHAVRVR